MAKIEYKVRQGGFITNKQAQVYGPIIVEIAENNNYQNVPEKIVEHAETLNSPLHDYFEWDDSIAGYKYRCEQARYLLRAIVTVVESNEKKEELRAVVHISKKVINDESLDNNKNGLYVPITKVFQHEKMYRDLLLAALRQAKSWQKQYEFIKELEPIRTAIDFVEMEINGDKYSI